LTKLKGKNGFVPGIKLLPVLSDVGTSVLETKKQFLVIAMKLIVDLLEKHMVMKLLASLMSMKCKT
jgi:hypothetical protein